MNNSSSKNQRVLGVALSTRGFGFAVLENQALVDWGIKSASGDKNRQSLEKLGRVMDHYRPHSIVLENHSAKGSRRSARIRALGQEMIKLANNRKVKVVL